MNNLGKLSPLKRDQSWHRAVEWHDPEESGGNFPEGYYRVDSQWNNRSKTLGNNFITLAFSEICELYTLACNNEGRYSTPQEIRCPQCQSLKVNQAYEGLGEFARYCHNCGNEWNLKIVG